MCCDNPSRLYMCSSGTWGWYCTNCHTFTPE